MTHETFKELWIKWATQWYGSSIQIDEQDPIPVSSLCEIKWEMSEVICDNYNHIKESVKELYFKDSDKKLSPYKRGAVIIYAIIKSEPIKYYDTHTKYDKYFLKQRLAFHIALGSIIQAFDQATVQQVPFYKLFNQIGAPVSGSDNDTFLESIYKDIFYSEIYRNFNILTTANVFGLLFEQVLGLTPTLNS